jgi:4a-hydroxytetrahydrobiopterin dehydratase
MELAKKKCVPCEGGIPRLDPARVKALLPEVKGWEAIDEQRKLHKRFKFQDFKQTMAFLVQMALIAETEGHHPDFAVKYSVVDVTIYTHDIGGLSENDFILAAKIDEL